jgi:integrase/recombinase XerD
MGEADVRAAAGRVLAALRDAGRSEGTIRRYQAVLDRFAAFLAGRGLSTASDQACVDFIAGQTGARLRALREPVANRDVNAVRRPAVLLADALAGREIAIGRPVIEAKDGCPARFCPLRDDYVASCRARGNAEATLVVKDKAASRFLGYLDEAGAGDLAALSVRDVSGFLLRQRGLRRKTVAGLRSALADFPGFLADEGLAPQGLAGRLPPHRHLRHESEPHLWTAEEIRRLLAVIDRQSATGKRDYAMILMTARLGLRISDLRQLGLGDLDWRAKALTIEPACTRVFIKHRHPFDAFGCSSSVASRLSRYAARAGIEFPPGQARGMHSLRGALAVAMIGNGAPMPVISAVLGHASTDTTQAYYLRFDVERLRCCALDVEDVLDRAEASEHGA